MKGALRLTRLALRRDRIQLPIWIAGAMLLLYAGAAAVKDEFPTEADAATALKGAVTSPAVLLMRGIPVGVAQGALVNFRNYASLLVLVALMSTFLVVRHTRQNEETGRSELIGSAAVGRHAALVAALTHALIANVLMGLFSTLALLGAGLPAAGSVAWGAASVLTGMSFAGIAALAAQVFSTARAANGFAALTIGVAYFVRGVGDALGEIGPDGIRVTSTWVAWVSPLGWGEQVRPYGDERWWVLIIPLLFTLVCAAGAYALVNRRDLGAGLVPARLGPPSAARSLLSPTGLAWRLQRGTVIGWVVGGAVFGYGIGTLGNTVNDAFEENKGVADLMGQLAGGASGGLVDVFYAAMMAIFGVLAAGFAVQVLLRLRNEETAGTAEAVLATATGRVQWVASHLTIAVGGAALLLAASGLAMGLGDLSTGGQTSVGTLVGAALVQLPAALTVAGFVVLAFGALPRISVALAWTGLVVSIVFGMLGDLFGLPQAARDISPFSHVPAVPVADPAVGPLAALLAVAVVLIVGGLALFRRRDLTS
ncbi:anibiotic ABC transporter [Hamadaea sp. NPDC051192]|uniref:ABC transporter permease n=1 Tax=Hamadaea sp. NPDC051192 TaxID=3154940 RepID=UPI003429B3C8